MYWLPPAASFSFSELTGMEPCCSWDEAHGQAVAVLHGLLRQVVGLSDAVEGAALARTNGVPGQQGDQDGLHHHHGDMFAHTGAGPTTKGLEEPIGHLQDGGGDEDPTAV